MNHSTRGQSSRLSRLRIRFERSKFWRFLPLVVIAFAVLAVASMKLIPAKNGPDVERGRYSEAEADLLCARFCDALLYCQSDALQGRDEATKLAVRSACYTGCRKHADRLASCESVLRNNNEKKKSGPEQCTLLSGCIK